MKMANLAKYSVAPKDLADEIRQSILKKLRAEVYRRRAALNGKSVDRADRNPVEPVEGPPG